MQRSDLVRVVADRTGVREQDVARVVNALFEEIERALGLGITVVIRGFGAWRTAHLTGNQRPNPGTGIRTKFPPSRTVRWKPAVGLRERLNTKCLELRDSDA